MTLFYLILALIIVLIVLFVWIRNTIVKYENATKRAWADVVSFERQKIKILDDLEPLLDRYSQFEQNTMTQVAGLRSHIMQINSQQQNTRQLEHIEQMSSELFKSINVQVEAYPELKADEIYQKVMQEITEQNENVGAAINIFNRDVELFNNSIQIFPNNIVNGMSLNRKPIRPFEDRVQSHFDYKPNFR